MKKLIIVGLGETAELAYEYFTKDSDYDVIAFAADKKYIIKNVFYGLPVFSLESILLQSKDYINTFFFVAISSGKLNYNRTEVYLKLKAHGLKFASYISSKAFVWDNVKIGENCFILENNVLQPFTKIGNNVVLWSGNHIGHRTVIDDNCFISSHVVISGYCRIGKNTFIGVNTSIADNIAIGKNNFITLGSVINKSTDDDTVLKGQFAEVMKISSLRLCKVKI